MTIKISSVPLTSPGEWAALRALVSADSGKGPLGAIFQRLAQMGAVSAVIEHEYLDRDFTSEFSAFYSKLFARYSKICKRVHFFSSDTAPILALDEAGKLSESLETFGKSHYLGFIVIRPVQHARLGRTVIAGPHSPPSMASKLLVRATYETHLLSASLEVVGAPLIEQDTRVGACAQAAVWSAGRHFHAKHRGPWISVNEITEEALKPADLMSSTSLPAGSSHLSLDGMIRALRKMGREPFTYLNPSLLNSGAPWTIDPAAAISRYIDSGMPVILGLKPQAGSNIGHAVVAVGHTTKLLPQTTSLPANPTRAIFCEAFLINDDQRGAYLRLPVFPGSPVAEVPFSIQEHLNYILMPLPSKVYRPAESAEEIAWDLIRKFYIPEMPKVKADTTFDIGASASASDQFIDAVSQNKLVARTYLTYGWKYRLRMVRNIVAETVKQAVIRHDLPRYVWVTEFGTLDSMNHLEPKKKRIFSHVVVDATSSQFHRSALFFHAPGLVKRWSHDSGANDGSLSATLIRVKDDAPYYPKVRGIIGY